VNSLDSLLRLMISLFFFGDLLEHAELDSSLVGISQCALFPTGKQNTHFKTLKCTLTQCQITLRSVTSSHKGAMPQPCMRPCNLHPGHRGITFLSQTTVYTCSRWMYTKLEPKLLPLIAITKGNLV